MPFKDIEGVELKPKDQIIFADSSVNRRCVLKKGVIIEVEDSQIKIEAKCALGFEGQFWINSESRVYKVGEVETDFIIRKNK